MRVRIPEKHTAITNLSAVVNAQSSDYSSRAFANAGGVLSRRQAVKTQHRIHRYCPGDFK
jgi:hypothetical protein